MFDDETLEKIFMHPETRGISIIDQSAMIKAIEDVLDEMEMKKNATISEH